LVMIRCVTHSKILRRSTIRDTEYGFFMPLIATAFIKAISDTNMQASAEMVNKDTCTRW
ncbi:2249_t:CDS:1, partial [Ambispora leptoticha]